MTYNVKIRESYHVETGRYMNRSALFREKLHPQNKLYLNLTHYGTCSNLLRHVVYKDKLERNVIIAQCNFKGRVRRRENTKPLNSWV